jgi:hypothetical protein
MDRLADLVAKQQAKQGNDDLRTKLETAADTVQYVQSGGLVDASQAWQMQIKPLLRDQAPFKVALDTNGNEVLQDQTKSLFLDVPADLRDGYKQVIADWQTAVATGIYQTDWQVAAKSDMDLGHSVYFELDQVGNVQVKENTADNVVPDFLKDDPYPDLTRNLPRWQQDALGFAAENKPFFLDIDPATQQIVAKAATAQAVVSYNQPPAYLRAQTGTAAILSLFA